MTASILLLIVVTLLYAGYNIFIKISGTYIPDSANTPVLATICLQAGALAVSLVFMLGMSFHGGFTFKLTGNAYLFATASGVSVGLGSYGYFFLFSGFAGAKPMEASVAIPTVVSGTIVISILVSALVLKEAVRWTQLLGVAFILTGIVLLFIRIGPSATA